MPVVLFMRAGNVGFAKAAHPPAGAVVISEDAPLATFDYEMAADGRGAERRMVSLWRQHV